MYPGEQRLKRRPENTRRCSKEAWGGVLIRDAAMRPWSSSEGGAVQEVCTLPRRGEKAGRRREGSWLDRRGGLVVKEWTDWTWCLGMATVV